MFSVSGTMQYHHKYDLKKAGADILLDSLSMGGLTSAQNSLLDGDLLSYSRE